MFRVIVGFICGVSGGLSAVMLIGMTGAIVVQVAGRVLGINTPDAGEVSGFLLGMMSFFALAYTFRSGGHIRVNILRSNLAGSKRRFAEIWCLGVSLAIVAFFAVSSASMVIDSFQFGSVSTGMLGWPLWIPQTGMLVGICFFGLVLVEALIDVFNGRVPEYDERELASD